MASFSELPIDMTEIIVKKANKLRDFLNWSATCKEWRSVALPFLNYLPCKIPRSLLLPLERPFPVLLIPSALSTDTHSFYSITERKAYNHDLFVPEISKTVIVGSKFDCVFIKKGDAHIELVNPFTREQLPLPPIPTMLDPFIESPCTKAIAPLDFDGHQVRSVVLLNSGILYYCGGVEKKWYELELPFRMIMDVLSLKGMLYFVAEYGEELFAVDLNASQKITKMALISNDFGSYHDNWVFVVESSGEILLIIMLHKWGPHEVTFRVFRLAEKTSSDEHKGYSQTHTHTLVEVKSLHGRILFLGVNQNSFSLDASLYPGSNDNCIYFIVSWSTDIYDDDRRCWRNVLAGVFHLEDKTTEYFSVKDGYMHHPLWLRPNLNALV